ncbi:heterokaryon incompatibility [Alternaria alternata]|nr:heterokaryon incompatibility [Alternaria alternata]
MGLYSLSFPPPALQSLSRLGTAQPRFVSHFVPRRALSSSHHHLYNVWFAATRSGMDNNKRLTQASRDSTIFKHQPLDHSKPSIRLVHLLPTLSPRNQIQCSITHATVGAKYTCLSYRWGDPSPSQDVLIDDKVFTVRQNLFEFLATAREKAASDASASLGPFWVDALCIDQSDVLERNHQVRQMGTIYRNAAQVYVWLGLMVWGRLAFLPFSQKAKALSHEWDSLAQNKHLLVQHVINNGYWTRAWIVQEVVLARNVILWLGATSIRFGDMLKILDYVFRKDTAVQSSIIFRLGHTWQTDSYKDKDLVHLLNNFRDQQCSDVRDRIFSLVSMVTGSGRHLEVNYNTSRAELAAEVLRQCKDSLCFCTALMVVQMLKLRTAGVPNSESDPRLLPCLELCVEYIPASSGSSHEVKSESRKWPPGLCFADTCESVSLYPARLNRYLTYWNDGGYVQQPQIQREGVGFKAVEGWQNIYIVRISLQFLATMVKRPVDICAHAKTDSQRRGLPANYPRICYATDHVEQPGTADSSTRWILDDKISTAPVRKTRAAYFHDGWVPL